MGEPKVISQLNFESELVEELLVVIEKSLEQNRTNVEAGRVKKWETIDLVVG